MFTIEGPLGPLEAVIESPATDTVPQPVIAVICHPLSTEGGSMQNKVVTTVARSLRELGVTTIRFNFRSVGESEGEFDHGVGESDDLASIVHYAAENYPGHALWLAGFSFGAYVSLRNAHRLGAKFLISIAPPVGRDWDFNQIHLPQCRWLIVQGESDEVVDAQQVYDWVAQLKGVPQLPELVKMENTTHFFHQRLIDLRGVIKNAAQRQLPKAV